MLTLHHEKKGLVDVISLDGILNADTTSKVEDALQSLSEGESPRILIDVPELTYISSAGIGCFIGVIKGIRMKGGDLRFSNMDAKIKRVFRLLDMDDFFQFFSDADEGVASFDS